MSVIIILVRSTACFVILQPPPNHPPQISLYEGADDRAYLSALLFTTYIDSVMKWPHTIWRKLKRVFQGGGWKSLIIDSGIKLVSNKSLLEPVGDRNCESYSMALYHNEFHGNTSAASYTSSWVWRCMSLPFIEDADTFCIQLLAIFARFLHSRNGIMIAIPRSTTPTSTQPMMRPKCSLELPVYEDKITMTS